MAEPFRLRSVDIDRLDRSRSSSQSVTEIPDDDPRSVLMRTPPEQVRDVVSPRMSYQGLAQSGMTDDPLKSYYILASEMFPDMPINEAVQRFATKDGNIVYLDTDGIVKRVRPSMFKSDGFSDTATRLGANVAQAGEILPDITGGVAELGTTGLTRSPQAGAAAGGVTAGVTNAGRQAVGEYFYKASRGDEATASNIMKEVDAFDAATEGALFWLTSQPFAIGEKLIKRKLNTNRLAVPEQSIPEVQARAPEAQGVLETARQEGIDMTIPQAVGEEGLLIRERQLRRTEPGATAYRDFFEEQFEQITRKLENDLLPKLSSGSATAGVVVTMKNAADDIIRNAEIARTQAVDEYYQDAFQSGVVPDVAPVERLIKQRLGSVAPGGVAAAQLKKAERLVRPGQTRLGPEGEDFLPDEPANFEQLHDAKINLDGIIEDLRDGLKGNEQKSALRYLDEVRSKLVQILRRAHPRYNEGADLYIDLTGPIDRMKNGMLGALQALRPTDAASAMNLGRLFDAFKVSDASLVREVRQAFQEAGKLEIFNKGFRAYMQEVIGRALKSAADADPASLSNRLVKELFKTPKQRAVFQEAVGDPKAYSDFVRFFDIIRRISKTKAEGSPTATDIGGIEELTGPAAKAVTTVTQPLRLAQRFGDWITKASIQRRSDQLATLYTTEAGRQALRETRDIKPTARAAGQALNRVLMTAIGEGFLGSPDRTAGELIEERGRQ